VDVICELLANVNLGQDLEVLATGGRVVIIGSRGTVTIDPRHLLMQESNILGMVVWEAAGKELKAIHAALGAGLANGTLKPVVGKELPLAEAAKAHHDIMEKKAYGKIVLIP
jgi:NADPH2:quinone reductase